MGKMGYVEVIVRSQQAHGLSRSDHGMCQLATPLRAASRQLRYHAEGYLTFETSRPTWVSVQDVVLNTLKDRPRNQVNYSQSSATFTTQAQNQRVLLMSLWFLLVCHALTQNDAESPVNMLMFLSTSQKGSPPCHASRFRGRNSESPSSVSLG